MLVLTRSTGEEIVIGADIRITVIMVRGDRVQLGITAPESVRVDRAEVYERRVRASASHAGADHQGGVDPMAESKHLESDRPVQRVGKEAQA